jgi:hypothetical protein
MERAFGARSGNGRFDGWQEIIPQSARMGDVKPSTIKKTAGIAPGGLDF